MKLLNQIKKFRLFLGREVWLLFNVAILVGFFWFAVESSFLLVMQGFLISLGVLDSKQAMLPSWYPNSLTSSVLLLFGFGVFRSIISVSKEFLLGVTGQAFIRNARTRVLYLGLHRANELSVHDVVFLFNESISQAGGVISQVSQLINTGTSLVLFLILGLQLAPKELLIGVVLLGLFVFPLQYFSRAIKGHGQGILAESVKTNETLLLGMKNFFFLRVYNLVPHEFEKGARHLRQYESNYRKFFIGNAFKNGLPMIVGIFLISLICVLGLKVFHTPALALLSFFYIFIRIAQGGSDLNSTLSTIRLNMNGFRTLYQWFEKHDPTGLSKTERPKALPQTASESPAFEKALDRSGVDIVINKLGFAYPNGPTVLKDISCKISKGEKLVIHGQSGAGKSTLLTLILGINTPQHGSVEINGFAAEQVGSILAKSLAYVGPEPYLIPGSVRENLIYGHPTPAAIADAELVAALKKAQIWNDVQTLSQGIDTRLNELTQLSSGQKQRLAIARALLRRPKLLILDEATANIDSELEGTFIQELNTILEDLTTIIISHKTSFDSIATSFLKLEPTARQ